MLFWIKMILRFGHILVLQKVKSLLVINNFYGEEITYSVPAHVQLDGMKQEILLSNYKDASKDITKLSLRPYESIVYRYTK